MKHAKERFSSSWLLFLLNFQESDIKDELTEIDYKRKSSSFMKQLSSDEVPTVDDYRIADEPISDTHAYVSSIDDPEVAKHVAFSGDDEDQAEIMGKNASLYCTGALCSKLTLSTI